MREEKPAQEVTHIPYCREQTRIYRMRLTRFKQRYPHYCRDCDATGTHWYQDHEGMWDDSPCAHCLNQGLCPRCMTPTIIEKKDPFYTVVEHYYDTCTACGWRGDDDYGDKYTIPWQPTCYCEQAWAVELHTQFMQEAAERRATRKAQKEERARKKQEVLSSLPASS